jgi:protein-S-isoprenylcysteine O-methyltransferase Ste14
MEAFFVYPGFRLQVFFIIVSVIAFTFYFLSYYLGKKYERINGAPSVRKFLKFCYAYIGSVSYLCWMIMSMLPQPRFPNLLSLLSGYTVELPAMVASGYGLAMMLYTMVWSFKATKVNFQVTLSNYDYLKPQRLITDGQYSIVRHPMVICAFFHVFGLALFTGAYYTLLFMPVFFILNDAMNWIQEKYVLKAEFPEAYKAYSKTTPRILTWWMAIILVAGGAFTILNFYHKIILL